MKRRTFFLGWIFLICSLCNVGIMMAQDKENCEMRISYPIDHKECIITNHIFKIAMDSIGNRIKENIYNENYPYKKSLYLNRDGDKVKITYWGSNTYLDSRQMIEMVKENDLLTLLFNNNKYVIFKYLDKYWDSDLYSKYLSITTEVIGVNYVDIYRMINGRDYYCPPVIVSQRIEFYLYDDRVEFIKDEIRELDMYKAEAGW